MMFKNAVIYMFTKPFSIDPEELTALMSSDEFQPVKPQEKSRTGWVSSLPGVEDGVFETNDCIFLRLRKDEKILKSSAINREVEELAAAIQREQGRKVRKKEKDELREQVELKHLPHALIDSTYTVGYIDLKKQWLIVEASSLKAAEDFASFLRRTLGSLPVRPPALEMAPGLVMTCDINPTFNSKKLVHSLLHHFTLGEECTMVGSDGEKANFKDMDLTSEEVTNHITESGMTVNSLRMSKEDKVAFTLMDDFRVKKIKFLDQFQEDILNYEPEDEDIDAGLSYARATLFLLTSEFRELFDSLIDAMGGIEESFDPMEGLE